MIYVALALICVLLAVGLVKWAKMPLHSPSVILLSGYAISLIMSAIGILSWNTEHQLSHNVILAITLGIFGFCGGDLLSKKILFRKGLKESKKYAIGEKLHIKKPLFYVSLLLYVVTVALVIKELNDICTSYECGAGTIPELISFFRNKSSLFSSDAVSFSFITSQLIKTCSILTIIYIYMFLNGLLNDDGMKKVWHYLLPLPLFVVLCLLQSGRGVLMVYIVAAVVIFMYLYLKKHSQNIKKVIIPLIAKMSVLVFAVLVLFYAVSPLLGRPAKTSFVDYISFYFGCSAPSFNIAVDKQMKLDSALPGENTFRGVYSALDKVHIIDYKNERSLPFVNISGHYSNVYTSAFRSYMDFGTIAVPILSAISGFILGTLHLLVLKKRDFRLLIFYALLCASILDMFRDESFYTNMLTTATLANILILIVLSAIIIRIKPNEKRINN